VLIIIAPSRLTSLGQPRKIRESWPSNILVEEWGWQIPEPGGVSHRIGIEELLEKVLLRPNCST
jgi:hypothetical protein